jgi:hypothetical protein
MTGIVAVEDGLNLHVVLVTFRSPMNNIRLDCQPCWKT